MPLASRSPQHLELGFGQMSLTPQRTEAVQRLATHQASHRMVRVRTKVMRCVDEVAVTVALEMMWLAPTV